MLLSDVRDEHSEHQKSITRVPLQTQPQTPAAMEIQLNSSLLMSRLNI